MRVSLREYGKCALLASHFLRRGYPLQILDSAFEKVKALDRSELLHLGDIVPPTAPVNNVTSSTETDPSPEKVFSITTYNPVGNPNQEVIKSNWSILGTSNVTQSIYKSRVIHGNHRCPNLRDSLVHSKLRLISNHSKGHSGATFVTCDSSTSGSWATLLGKLFGCLGH